ncbi:MAG: hypothetical protein MMC23_002143 [Stictis urceolatum]|nr:hypothetical protein [Stictis urceolata]
MESLKELEPYADGAVNQFMEGLRCHPAVGMSLPRVTPQGGIETVVGVNLWVVHRDEAVFGSDTDVFWPDRWIGTDTSDMGSSHQFGTRTHQADYFFREVLLCLWVWCESLSGS